MTDPFDPDNPNDSGGTGPPLDDGDDRAIARALGAATDAAPGVGEPVDEQAVADYQRVLSYLPFDELAPPAGLDERVFAAATSLRAEAPTSAPVRAPASIDRARRRRARSRRAAMALAVAAAVVAVSLVVVANRSTGARVGRVELATASRSDVASAIAQPGARTASFAGSAAKVVLTTAGTGYVYGLDRTDEITVTVETDSASSAIGARASAGRRHPVRRRPPGPRARAPPHRSRWARDRARGHPGVARPISCRPGTRSRSRTADVTTKRTARTKPKIASHNHGFAAVAASRCTRAGPFPPETEPSTRDASADAVRAAMSRMGSSESSGAIGPVAGDAGSFAVAAVGTPPAPTAGAATVAREVRGAGRAAPSGDGLPSGADPEPTTTGTVTGVGIATGTVPGTVIGGGAIATGGVGTFVWTSTPGAVTPTPPGFTCAETGSGPTTGRRRAGTVIGGGDADPRIGGSVTPSRGGVSARAGPPQASRAQLPVAASSGDLRDAAK